MDSKPNHIRSKIINDAIWLADNPYLVPDDPRIVPFLTPPVLGKMFKDDFHWMIFYTEGERLIVAK